MARKKATPKSAEESEQASLEEKTPSLDDQSQQSQPVLSTREPIKVNKFSLTELKNACDDTLKKYLSRPNSFQQQHTHTDVRLALGYSSIVIGGASVFYSWKVGFAASKILVAIGVALYFILTSLQTLYIWYVEKETIFVGKRKTLDKRILTERLTIGSKTIESTRTTAPKYSIDISYLYSSNGGKTILKRGKENGQKGYNELFDEDGYLAIEEFEQWVEELVTKAISS